MPINQSMNRRVIVGLFTLSLLTVPLPAVAGLGDLIDGLSKPVESLPVVGEVVKATGETLDPVVDPVVGLIDPVVDPIIDPVTGSPSPTTTAPPVDDRTTPTTTATTTPTATTTTAARWGESSTATTVLSQAAADDRQPAPKAPAGSELQSDPVPGGNVEFLRQALVSRDLAPSTPAAPVVAVGWLPQLAEWLRGAIGDLADLLMFPVRLVELLARALLSAGAGLVAPASLLAAIVAWSVWDRRPRAQVIG
jgi:hypothetical protein